MDCQFKWLDTSERGVPSLSGKCMKVNWYGNVWRPFVPPRISVLVWKILNNALPTAMALKRRSITENPPAYIGCIAGAVEDVNHVFIHCNMARNLWAWMSQVLGENITLFNCVVSLIRWAARLEKKNSAYQVKMAAVFVGLWSLWTIRSCLAKTVSRTQCY